MGGHCIIGHESLHTRCAEEHCDCKYAGRCVRMPKTNVQGGDIPDGSWNFARYTKRYKLDAVVSDMTSCLLSRS
jgi:hypothetical protein